MRPKGQTELVPTASPSPFASHPRVLLQFDHEAGGCPRFVADARRPGHALFTWISAAYSTGGQRYAECGSRDEFFKGALPFELVSRRLIRRGSASTLRVCSRTEHVRVTRELTLDRRRPWLHMRYTMASTGAPMRAVARQLEMPCLVYGPRMENPLDAQEVSFSFGRILPRGYERPPYLTFWLKGRASGVILWARNRESIRHLFPRDHALQGGHPSLYCGSNSLANAEWDETFFKKPHAWDFFLWPVTAREWKPAVRKLESMKFKGWEPRRLFIGQGFPRSPRGGLTLSASDLAAANPRAIARTPAARCWWLIRGPAGSAMLFAQDPIGTRPLRVKHRLKGRYRIRMLVNSGTGIQIRLPGAPYPLPFFRDLAENTGHLRTPRGHPYFHSLIERTPAREMDLGAWDLQPGTVELLPSPGMYDQTILVGLRFEPETETPPTPLTTGPRALDLYGICDTPDVAFFDSTPTDLPYRANAAEHPRAGFKLTYWRADGQCCDFHTKVGTVRYPVLRVHGLFTPVALPYGLALRKHDLLTAAVEEVHKHGGEIYGYMRINGYGGNVTPRFHAEHPELHDEAESGAASIRLCFHLPAVRKWKVEIAREIVRHGVDGLLIDLTRTPPMVEYHPAVVRAYEQKHGGPPPRNPDRGFVSYGVHPLETGEEWTRWWKFRAEGFTRFGRELRAMLKEEGRPRLPIHLQVRPMMALFDGLDLGAWIDEKLVDLLNVWPTPGFEVPEEIFAAARGRIPLRCTVSVIGQHDAAAEQKMETVVRDPRFQGLTIYESDAAVWSTRWRTVMARLLGGLESC
ncbi:MAG: hypothetical protein ACOYMV_05325 [Verrucomicrobiia bacterium]